MEILPCCRSISITVWLHYWEFNKTLREKARWELYNDAIFCFEEILEAVLHKTFTVTHLLSSKPSNTYMGHCQRNKDELISYLPWIPTHGHTSVDWPSKIYIHQLCVDIGCRLVDLVRVMVDRNGIFGKRIYAVSTPWWW